MDNQLDDLNDLVTELKNTKSLAGIMMPPGVDDIATKPENVNEDNIDDFIFRKSATLIQQGVDTIESLKGTVLSGADAETVGSYSKLLASVAASIEILNKISLQKRKEKAARSLKQMDIDNSSKLLDKYDGSPTIQNQTNNVLIASREEIMKIIMGKADDLITKTQMEDEKNIIDIKT